MTGGRVVAYYPALARKLGSIAAALFLQQIAHLAGEEQFCEDGEWVEVSQGDLESMLAMTPKIQQAARNRLLEANCIEERRPRRKGGHMQYRASWSEVQKLLESPIGIPKRQVNTSQSDTPNGKSLYKRDDKSKEDSLRSSSGEGTSDDGTPPMEIGQYLVKYTYDVLDEFRHHGKDPAPEDPDEIRKSARIAKTAITRKRDPITIEQAEAAMSYQVQRASGEVEGQPKAWVGFHTALDVVKAQNLTTAGNALAPKSLTGVTEEQKQGQRQRRKAGYEWLLDQEGVAEPQDLDAKLRALREEDVDETD
jgi:hypothetical protein